MGASGEHGAPLHDAVARIVRERRRRLGLRQEEVARRMGTSQAQVSRIENPGQARGSTLGTLERLSEALGIELEVSVREKTEPPLGAGAAGPAEATASGKFGGEG